MLRSDSGNMVPQIMHQGQVWHREDEGGEQNIKKQQSPDKVQEEFFFCTTN